MELTVSAFTRINPPAAALTLDEAKAHLKVDTTADDTLIQSMIVAAHGIAENKTGRAFGAQNWKWTGNDWPSDYFTLTPGPLNSITSVKYFDSSNVEITMSASDYQVDKVTVPGRILFKNTYSVFDRPDAINIEFACGHELIPEEVKAWIKIQLTTLYEMRQEFIPGQSLGSIRSFTDSLIYPYIL